MIEGVPETFVAMSPIGLMVLYFIGTSLTIANYAGYMRFNNDVYDSSFVRAYLVFTIFGAIGYYLAAGPAWLWAAKYSETTQQRVRRTAIGMAVIFFLHDLPCFIMEWHAVLCCGWRNDFQSFVFIVQILQFAVSFSFGWLGYTYILSGYLENNFGSSSLRGTGGGLKTGADVVQILPPMSAAATPILGQFSPREVGDGRRPAVGPQPVRFPASPMESASGSARGRASSHRDPRTPLSVTGSVRWAGSNGFSPQPVPLREGLADKRDLDEEEDEDDDDSLDGDDAYYAAQQRKATGITIGGPSPREEEARARYGGGYAVDVPAAAAQRYAGGTQRHDPAPRDVEMDSLGRAPSSSRAPSSASRQQPMTYSLPPVSVRGSQGGYGGGYGDDDTPPTAPAAYGGGGGGANPPRRLGSVFIERTTI